MAAGEPVMAETSYARPRSMFGNGWRHGIEYFCRQCAGDIYAHSEGKCAFCKREIHDCAHQGCAALGTTTAAIVSQAR